jgi:hypothetical protein
MRVALTTLLALTFSFAQVQPRAARQSEDLLSDDELRLALDGKGRDRWVQIEGVRWVGGYDDQVPKITLYMAESVLAMQSEGAKREGVQFEPGEEGRRRSVMIVAECYAGKTIAEGCNSITRILLLSDPGRNVVAEPYFSQSMEVNWRSQAWGATNTCRSLLTRFSLKDVRKVREAARNGEFFAAVFSNKEETEMYKIEKKHQAKLELE